MGVGRGEGEECYFGCQSTSKYFENDWKLQSLSVTLPVVPARLALALCMNVSSIPFRDGQIDHTG